MDTNLDIYVFSLFLTSIIAAVVGSMAWRRRPSKGAVTIVVMMGAVSIWALFQALMFIGGGLWVKLLLANMRYFGIEVVPIAFYVLACEYKDRVQSFSLRKWMKHMVVPFLFIIVVWTNNLHYKFYLSVKLENGILQLESGPAFWINMMYLYIFISIAVYLFIKAYLNSISIYRKQAMIIAVAAFIPIAANLIFNFELLPLQNVDITPMAFLITGILYFYALFQYKLLDVVPVARGRLIEEMDDIVIVLDNRKRILDLNKKARELILNGQNVNFIGESILEYLDRWKELYEFIANSANVNERIVYTSNGCVEYYHLRISNIYDKSNNKSGELIVLRNITELEKALLEARNAKDAAEYANKSKGYFLANMSHEIRTPMNAVIGIAEILDTTELPKDKQKNYIKMIINSAEALLTIINDILDFSKIEAGRMEVEKCPLNLRNLVNETVETFSISATNKSVKLTSFVDEGLNNHLLGDPVRIRQILTNLIGNSIKFTSEGKVEVIVEQAKRQDNLVFVDITVCDTGIGIPEEKIERIFESFKQVDSSTTRKFGGTGLGLSISKSLVELMGGSIRVESQLGKGSRFCCSIPFQILSDEGESLEGAKKPKAEEISLAGLKILVAEDNKVNREVISMHLKKLGCTFEFAENGAVAVEKFDKNNYNIILMDVQMPEMDGLEAAQKIREKEKSQGGHIPIIALTAGAMKEDINQCLEAGMDAHLSKPIKVQNLYNMLKNYENTK